MTFREAKLIFIMMASLGSCRNIAITLSGILSVRIPRNAIATPAMPDVKVILSWG